jgi:hypothetical protein
MGTLLNAEQISSLPRGKLSLDKIVTSKPTPPELRKYLEVLQLAIEITRVNWSNVMDIETFNARNLKMILQLTTIGMDEESETSQNVFMGLQDTLKKFRIKKDPLITLDFNLLSEDIISQLYDDLIRLKAYLAEVSRNYKRGNDDFPRENFEIFGEYLFTFVAELFAYVDNGFTIPCDCKIELEFRTKTQTRFYEFS